MTAKTRAKPSLHRDSFVAPLPRGTRTLPGAVVGLRLLKHTAGPLLLIRQTKIMIVNLLDSIRILYKDALWFFFRTENLCTPNRFAPTTRLHMAIHGFAYMKFAKPDDEHHLQASANASQTSICLP
jgi:hypothetical protein